ncbi:hypothetical protein ACFQ48_05990 [Hymenobacter caeli]|uniref:Restriction endonuclease type IV Mrr domain-containing protein n=1 Tax=Hymenobacter caeli TaxID=2735894 RepID=A0ABX2FN29_9BACT|nr:hypothetical protein [Hymenobacter caeli]NRT18568.1 hypothetical protein [Hymenobacter caeli]
MAYSDFSSLELKRRFGIRFRAESLFSEPREIQPSAWLQETLRLGQELGFNSEKSRSERLVTPLLLELSNLNQHRFAIYSGMNLDVDELNGLKGECDFIFSFSRIQDFVTAPIFCITEAKKQDLEHGTVQCAAQLLGARRLNEAEQNAIPVIYGCSTTGIEWRFLKLVGQEIIIDEARLTLAELPRLLGILQAVIDAAGATLPSAECPA